jgi:hypothetical protein
MAYDEALAERVRGVISLRENVVERKMFGGIAWMVGGNMACGVPAEAEKALAEPHTREFDFTGRPMRNIVRVAPAATAEDSQLAGWIDAGGDFASSLPPK